MLKVFLFKYRIEKVIFLLSWTVYLLFAIGLVALIKGANWAIDAAVWISKALGIPEVIVGATIVSIGTTLPETMIGSFAAYQGSSEVVTGTVMGSILFNTAAILGLGCLITPINVKERDSFVKIGTMIGVIILFGLLSADGSIKGLDSFILIMLLLSYFGINIWATSNSSTKNDTPKYTKKQLLHQILVFIIGLSSVVIGARVLLNSGEQIARTFGISEALIALTMFAIGSSLPELVTSLTAAIKGYNKIMLGNILGANTLNVIMVACISSLIKPLTIDPDAIYLQISTALLIMAVLFIPAFVTKKINRLQGLIAFVIYLAFIVKFATG